MIRFIGRGAAFIAVIGAFVSGASFSALDPDVMLGLFAQNRGDIAIVLMISAIVTTISLFTLLAALRR